MFNTLRIQRALCLVFCLFTLASVGQTNLSQQYLKDYQTVVPSPNVASLLAPSRQAVTGYSGQTEIKIDIFTIPGIGFQIPVSLSYTTSGFNVNETPSWVGAGWTLQGTGVIGRTIRDMPDNSAYGYFSDSMDDYFRGDGRPNIDSLIQNCIPIDGKQINSLISNTSQQDPFDPANYYLPLDSEPDLYHYALPTGLSGQFVFNRKKELVQLSPNGSSIDAVGNFTTDFIFIIKDGLGNLYYFNNDLANEKVKVNTLCDNLGGGLIMNTPEISAWNLIAIQSAVSSELASFSYTDETLVYQTNVSKTNMVKLNAFGTANFVSDPEDKTCYSVQTAYSKRPYIISSNGYSIQFVADSIERLDLTGGHRLKKIIVKFQGELIKTIELFHSYFKEDQFLRLDSIVEFSGNKRLPAYKFTYDDQEPFPSKGTFDQDHWGYFNNAGNTEFTTEIWLRDFPLSFINSNYPSSNHVTRYIPGANREPHPVYGMKGMLTNVTYPTGGSTEFLYELNSYANIPIEFKSTKRQYSPSSSIGRFTIAGAPFTTNPVSYNYLRIKDIETCEPEGEGGQGLEACAFVNLHNLTTDEWYTLTKASKNALIKVKPGNYEMIMGSTPAYGRAHAELEWFNYSTEFETEKMGGGFRVKRINYKNNDGEILESKRWNYWKPDSTSSGYLHSTPYYYVTQALPPVPIGGNYRNPITQLYQSGIYSSTSTIDGGGTGFGGCDDSNYAAEFLAITSDLKYPMQKFAGSWVGYDRIEEIQSNLADTNIINGKLITFYYTNKSVNLDNIKPAAPPKKNYSNINGRVLKEEVYAANETVDKKISETVFTYNFLESDPIWGLVTSKRIISGCPSCYFEYSIYSENVYTAQLKSIIKTEYGDVNALTSTTFMSYVNYNDTYFKKSESKVLSALNLSSPDTLKTLHFYPFEMAPEKSEPFINRNFIQTPYASLLIRAGKVIDGIYKSYSSNQHILMDSVLSLYSPNGLLMIDPYQLIGNPTLYFQTKAKISYTLSGLQSSITTHTGQTTNYLWGSYAEVPVASVVDTGRGAYFYDSFEESLYGGNHDNPRTGRYYAVLPKPLNFSPLASGEYLLSYYYRGNSNQPWEFKQRLINYPDQTFNIAEAYGHIDEVRIIPSRAQMTSYTYYPGRGITSVNDPNNRFILYNYDEFGRLKSKVDGEGNLIQAYQYHYKGQSND